MIIPIKGKCFGFGTKTALAVLCFAGLLWGCRAQKAEQPNIILIYADDLGYSDVSSIGQQFGNNFTETPNIDKFAGQGMNFTNAYAPAPICSPSRAALLTGKSPARLGFEFVTMKEGETYAWDDPSWVERFEGKDLIAPPFTMKLPLEEVTIAEALQGHGYATGIVGKWHIAPHHKRYLGWSPEFGPKQQGFEWAVETYGSHPYRFSIEGRTKNHYKEEGVYPVDSITTNAISFLKDHQKSKQPFFLYVSHYYVHTPIGDNVDWLIEKYMRKGNGKITRTAARYAAFVELLDHYVGQLLTAVDNLGLNDNTVVVFTSDNGGHPNYAYNFPFRGSKWNVYEGGIRIPMMIRWPDHIKAGSSSDIPVNQTDFMPTFVAMAGGAEPDSVARDKIDGTSILPLLEGSVQNELENRALLWHFPYYHPEGEAYTKAKDSIGVNDGQLSKTHPQSALRVGNYKLVYQYETDKVELYDLDKDIQEMVNIADKRPEVAKRLKHLLDQKLRESHARLPRSNKEQ
ncbi:MAG: sulfatase [Flavobacteriaceae bacterium]|nr:sulfatase [Flavobacteriaceae bacterium]